MSEIRRQRPTRTPIGAGNVLTAQQRPGYVRRFVNDVDGRVERFIEAGYEPVKTPMADTSDPKAGKASILSNVVRKPVGGGMHAVLMEIPEYWHAEDQAARQREVDAIEETMAPNEDEGQFGKVEIKR